MSFSAALVLSSCSGNGDTDNDESPRVPQEDVDRLNSELSEAIGLAADLRGVGDRITRHCMEEQGFSIHPESLDSDVDMMQLALPGTEVLHNQLIPETDVASTEGLGQHEVWQDALSDDYVSSESDSSPEWEAAGEEYREEYLETRGERDFSEISDLDEDELPETPSSPDPGEAGCGALTNYMIYDSDAPELADIDRAEIFRFAVPPLPADLTFEPYEIDFHTPELIEAKREWNACLDSRGAAPVSEVSGISAYVQSFYGEHPNEELGWNHEGGGEDQLIDPPEEAPWGFEDAKEQEIAYATDLAECADETDLRETRQAEWDQTLASMALEHEEALYLWQEQVHAALEEAQQLLAD